MKYLCLRYHDERRLAAMTDAERRAHCDESQAYDAALCRKGFCLQVRALPAAATAITLRFENGKVSVSEGPFADTVQQLGAILLLEARDLNHAIQLMSQLPGMRVGGSLEIRPIE